MFLTRKSLNNYQAFGEPSASGTREIYINIPQDVDINILAVDDSHEM